MTEFWLEYTPNWNDGLTESLLDQVLKWNNAPSYQQQIKLVFDQYQLEAPEPTVLKNRHTLAHEGVLSSKTKKPIDYLSDIVACIVRLLLRMLNYSGQYFEINKGLMQLKPLIAPQPK